MNSRNHLICHFIHGILGSSHKRDTSARKKLQWTVFHYIYHFVSLHYKETLCLLSNMSWTRIAHNSVASCLWKYHQVASPCRVSPKYWCQRCKYLFCHSFHCNVFSGRLSRQVYKCLISLPSSVLGNGFLTYLYCEQTVVWQFRLLVEDVSCPCKLISTWIEGDGKVSRVSFLEQKTLISRSSYKSLSKNRVWLLLLCTVLAFLLSCDGAQQCWLYAFEGM